MRKNGSHLVSDHWNQYVFIWIQCVFLSNSLTRLLPPKADGWYLLEQEQSSNTLTQTVVAENEKNERKGT